MRRMTWLWLCLVGALVMLGAVGAGAAGAATCHQHLYGTACESEKEHAEFEAFASCPFSSPLIADCSWAQSTLKEVFPKRPDKEEWEAERGRATLGMESQFKAGNVSVILRNPITLRGAIGFNEEGEEIWLGAEGAETIQAVSEPGPPLTKDVNTSLLSPSELNRYNYYTKVAHETKTTATVELAGSASEIEVSVEALLSEEGVAFQFPVKVHLQNPFVGSSCYVGSNEHPIVVPFTTGISGDLQGKNGSKLTIDKSGAIITVLTDTLVNDTFSSPGVEGCGVEGGADEAVDSALGLPSASGNLAVLNGTLKLTGAESAKEGLEGKI